MAPARTGKYSIWRSCERFQLRPPNVKEKWHDNHPYVQAELMGYNDIRLREDAGVGL